MKFSYSWVISHEARREEGRLGTVATDIANAALLEH